MDMFLLYVIMMLIVLYTIRLVNISPFVLCLLTMFLVSFCADKRKGGRMLNLLLFHYCISVCIFGFVEFRQSPLIVFFPI